TQKAGRKTRPGGRLIPAAALTRGFWRGSCRLAILLGLRWFTSPSIGGVPRCSGANCSLIVHHVCWTCWSEDSQERASSRIWIRLDRFSISENAKRLHGFQSTIERGCMVGPQRAIDAAD